MRRIVLSPVLSIASSMVLCAAACSSNPTSTSSNDAAGGGTRDLVFVFDGGGGGNGDLAGNVDLANTPTINVSGTIVDLHDGKPIAGATACQWPTLAPCSTAQNDGAYSLALPANAAQTGVLYSAAGHFTSLAQYNTGALDIHADAYDLLRLSDGSLLSAPVGQTIQAGGAILGVSFARADKTPVAGASITIAPTSGAGPFYYGMSGMPDKNATSTSSNGAAYALNMNAGDVQVTASAPNGLYCTIAMPGQGWVGSKPEIAKVTLLADTITFIAFRCQ
jgi:hypothetical protein